ncbi:hypothetical protein KVT40_006004 [Elsinoe batatas]|uniref:Uncharacterized protein n=1 Tax=Elsinoe batatas TaxID=2601811 RepID=A0A8K0PFS5_9PEZI|nr:hypothetical protein KVT40_006004 [Elsinoe batatas]
MDFRAPGGQSGGPPPPVQTNYDPDDPFNTPPPAPNRQSASAQPARPEDEQTVAFGSSSPGTSANPDDETLQAQLLHERRKRLEGESRLARELLDERWKRKQEQHRHQQQELKTQQQRLDERARHAREEHNYQQLQLEERLRHDREMLEKDAALYNERRQVRDWVENVRQEKDADEKAKREKSAKKKHPTPYEDRAERDFFRTPTRKVWPPPQPTPSRQLMRVEREGSDVEEVERELREGAGGESGVER